MLIKRKLAFIGLLTVTFLSGAAVATLRRRGIATSACRPARNDRNTVTASESEAVSTPRNDKGLVFAEVFPFRVHRFNQFDLFGSAACLDILLCGDSIINSAKAFMEDQLPYIIATGKAAGLSGLMFIDSLLKVAGNSGVNNPVSNVSHHINPVGLHKGDYAALIDKDKVKNNNNVIAKERSDCGDLNHSRTEIASPFGFAMTEESATEHTETTENVKKGLFHHEGNEGNEEGLKKEYMNKAFMALHDLHGKKANNQSSIISYQLKRAFIRAIRRVWSLTSRLSLRGEAYRRDRRYIAATEDKSSVTDDVSARQKMYQGDKSNCFCDKSSVCPIVDLAERQTIHRSDNKQIREVSAIVAGMVKISTLYLKGTENECISS